jgi:hypothetical protein
VTDALAELGEEIAVGHSNEAIRIVCSDQHTISIEGKWRVESGETFYHPSAEAAATPPFQVRSFLILVAERRGECRRG